MNPPFSSIFKPFHRVATLEAALAIAATASAAGVPDAADPGEPAPPPNVLLIIVEDMGLATGAYGDDTVPTPHLDALARRGVRYTRAYTTSPTCSPARAGILTGTFPHADGQYGLSHLGYTMHDGVPTLPGALKNGGYRIGRLGKLHVEGTSMQLPETPPLNRDQRHDPRYVAARAGEFFAAGDEPFFLEIAMSDAHRPFKNQIAGDPAGPVRARDVQPFAAWGGLSSPKILEGVAGYYNAVQRIDMEVGLLMDGLRESGKLNNTIVIFTGDHGPAFARGKVSLYEFGTLVPLIVAGPGITEGEAIDAMVKPVDLMPSLLASAALPVPEGLHGIDLSRQWSGGEAEARGLMFTELTAHGAEAFLPMRAVRDERYKLIVYSRPGEENPTLGIDGNAGGKLAKQMADDGETPAAFAPLFAMPAFEFYDLEVDPHELKNLADAVEGDADLKAAKDRLAAALVDWQRETNDPVVVPGWMQAVAAHHDAREHRARIDMKPYVGTWPVTAEQLKALAK